MRKSIKANDGMILTNGEIYGSQIFLAEGVDESAFHEITEEEFEEITRSEKAEDADYLAALERFGVK